MAYWLMKSEPGAWSWDQQKKEGKAGAEWDGVRNYQARNNMRAMKKGDLAFFYHSVGEKACVGIVKVVAEAHPDSTDGSGQWECVDVAAVADLPKPVTLADIKATPQLKDMVLVNNSRLSVQPVTVAEWQKVCALGGLPHPPKA
ncbi:ubiquinol-cytochrome C reductase [Methyloceanibacter superfactus]|uniref:Ubiquinol-cytochrome C reductase n=1 Tax=Methyloceanibacter superfactus TaxID=1774969 RepID=A0A1E3W8A1_9HYPH|nr:EVE domain-containing protein [Methyloceanibacter superfactus]ODS02006.1 ubiquinol-cytochrome C reductase [Methyloceanibacter superfactus]